jgi:hypothetical protein
MQRFWKTETINLKAFIRKEHLNSWFTATHGGEELSHWRSVSKTIGIHSEHGLHWQKDAIGFLDQDFYGKRVWGKIPFTWVYY